MSRAELLAGLAFLLVSVGLPGIAAGALVARFAAPLAGVVRVVAVGLAWSALVCAVHLAPALFGVLSRGTVAAVAVVTSGAALLLARRRRSAGPGADPAPATGDEPRWARLLPALLGVALAGCALAALSRTAAFPPTGLDAQNFQLPIPARWIQTGSVWQLDQYIVDYSNATYPLGGNLLFLAAMLPWHSPFAASLATVPLFALALAATWAATRELGAPPAAAALGALVLGAVPIVSRTGLEGSMSDGPMLAWLAGGVLFLLRHARTGRRADLVLAGLGLGLAFGSKWYAVPAVPVVLAGWALARRPRPAELGLAAAVVAGAGGIWLVRNAVLTGNPLFPDPAGGLFAAPPDPLRERAGFSLAHYATDLGVWRDYLRPAFAVFLGGPGLALAVGAAVAGAAALRRRAGGPATVAATTLVLACLYVVTPYSALGLEGRPDGAGVSTRYALPALLGTALLLGWALGRLRGRALVLAELLLALAVLDGLRRTFGGVGSERIAVGALVAVAAAGLARRAPRPVLAALAAVVVVAGAEELRTRAAASSLAGGDPALVLLEARAPTGVRVGLAGRWSNGGPSPVLVSFGPRLDNRVTYVGRFEQHMLRAHRGPAALARALDRGDFDLLVVGLGAPPDGPDPAAGWARRAGWRTLARSERLELLAPPAAR